VISLQKKLYVNFCLIKSDVELDARFTQRELSLRDVRRINILLIYGCLFRFVNEIISLIKKTLPGMYHYFLKF